MNRWTLWRALLCVPLASSALAEVVQTRESAYDVRYADNAVERYAVRWTLNVTTTIREEGGAPIPYQGAVANLRCQWSIASSVERSVSLVTRLGQAMPLPNMSRTLKAESADVVKGEDNASCKDPRSRREAEVRNAGNAARERFEKFAAADLETLKSEARAAPNVAAVTELPRP